MIELCNFRTSSAFPHCAEVKFSVRMCYNLRKKMQKYVCRDMKCSEYKSAHLQNKNKK